MKYREETKHFIELWGNLIDAGIATAEELMLICDINGDTLETLNDVLYVRTGYRYWEQYEEEYKND